MGIFLVRSSLIPFDENQQKRLIQSAQQVIHIQYQSYNWYFLANHKLAIFHFATDNYFYSCKEQICLNQSEGSISSVTILQGYCWSSVGADNTGKILNAFDVDLLLRTNDFKIDKIRDFLGGEYAIIHASNEGNVIAFNDRLSVEHIYYSQNKNISSITNRIALLPRINNQYEYNIEGMLALPVVGYMLGEDTYMKETYRLAQGASINLYNGELILNENKNWIYQNAPSKDDVKDSRVFNQIVEQGVEQCLANVKAIFDSADSIPLALTGGKDSRLILALALQAGLRDKLRLFTNGIEEHPDVIVAKQLANYLQLPHKTNKPGRFRDPTLSTEELLRRLATHVFQNDGMFGAWDLKAGKQCVKGLVLAGFIGEVFKGYIKKPFNYETMPNPEQMISAHGPFDPLAILKEDARRKISTRIQNRMSDYLGPGSEFNDIPDLYYIKERIPNWLGAARRKDADSNQVVMPINSTGLIRLAFALNATQRQQELIHFAMLRRLEPSFLEIPFAQQTWHQGLTAYGASNSMFKEPIMPSSNIPSHGSWQHTINKNPKFRAAIFEILADHRESPFWEVIDRQKTLNVINTTEFSMPQMISVLGLITVFFKVHHIEIPQKSLAAHRSEFKVDDHVILEDVKSGLLFNFDQNKKREIISKNYENEKPIKVAKEALGLIPGAENIGKLSFEGFIDFENSQLIPGWVWCIDFPFMKLTVEVLENGKVIDRIVANQFREDLKKAGKGNGDHSFRYNPRGKPIESLIFRVLDTGFELKKSRGRK